MTKQVIKWKAELQNKGRSSERFVFKTADSNIIFTSIRNKTEVVHSLYECVADLADSYSNFESLEILRKSINNIEYNIEPRLPHVLHGDTLDCLRKICIDYINTKIKMINDLKNIDFKKLTKIIELIT